MAKWNDGHAHQWVYFGGFASCSECAASVAPNGRVKAPTQRSRQHRQMAQLAEKNGATKRRITKKRKPASKRKGITLRQARALRTLGRLLTDPKDRAALRELERDVKGKR